MGLLSKLFGGGKGPAAAPGAAAEAAPKREACPRCGGTLLAGEPCPFCNPRHFGEEVDESAAAPAKGIASLAGVIVADRAARQHGAKGFLHIYEGPEKGATVLLGGRLVSIGRDPKENVLALKDGGVSTRHCEVRPARRGFEIVDLGSRNGTFVNDQRVQEKVLANGDIVGFGETRIYVGIS